MLCVGTWVSKDSYKQEFYSPFPVLATFDRLLEVSCGGGVAHNEAGIKAIVRAKPLLERFTTPIPGPQ